MSMPANCEKAIWEMLDHNCGLDAGRTAFVPESGLLFNSFKSASENNRTEHQIKTIMSGAAIRRPESDEHTVLQVLERRKVDGNLEYQARFATGELEWLPARDFMDPDGVVSGAWLAFAEKRDLEAVLSSFTAAQLKVFLYFHHFERFNTILGHV